MPGMPQGRDINESGQKSVSLVTVRDDRSIEIEERATSIAQFERLDVNISGAIEWHDVVHAIRSALEELRSSIFSPHLVVRLKLVGNTSLAWQIIRDQDLLLAEAEQIGERTGSVWLEKLDIDVRTLEEFVDGADPVQELAQTMRSNARSEAFREQARALIHRLVDELPPEVRDFAGKDESEANDFLERALSEGTDLVTARLRERGLQ